MSRHPFILASSSPRRLALLRDIGIFPDSVVAAGIDETPQAGEMPRHLAQRLAREKLEAVMKLHAGAFVLAADTVVACGRRILPKAEHADDVRRCLTLLSGRRHHVYTGVALATPGGSVHQRVSDSTVIFRRMLQRDIDAYANKGEGLGKAGGYAIQGAAAAYVRFISGSFLGIVGLPLYEVAQMLDSAGFRP